MKPLSGRRILITRAQHQAGSLYTALQSLGADVLAAPMIEIVPPDSYAPLDDALRNLARYDWLLLTSANGAAALRCRMEALGLSVSDYPSLQVCAIGPATAHTLQRQGWTLKATPKVYVAEAVVGALQDALHDPMPDCITGKRVLLVRAKVARDAIPAELTRLGAQVHVVEAYQTVMPPDAASQMKNIFANATKFPDAVTFTSSSTVKHFFLLLHSAGWNALPQGMLVASIGPITSQTLREHGIEPEIEAQTHSIPGLVDVLTAYFSRKAKKIIRSDLP